MTQSEQMVFRLVRDTDASLLKEWRNDEGTRMSSRRQRLVTEPAEQWLAAFANEKPGRVMYLAFKDEQPVGWVYADQASEDYTEISYVIAPGCRGQGLGTLMVTSFVDAYLAGRKVMASIFEGNAASENVAVAIGLRPGRRVSSPGDPRVLVEWVS